MKISLENKSWHQNLGIYFLFLFIVVLVFWKGLWGDFILDDFYQVRDSPFMNAWVNIFKIFSTTVWDMSSKQEHSHIYRPLMMTSYLVTNKIFGMHPVAFHFVNFLIHTANGLMFMLLLQTVGIEKWISFGAALLFLVHPLTSEANIWIGGVQDLQSLFFPLLTLLFLDRFKPQLRKDWMRLGMLIFLCFISKEINVALLPLLIVFLVYKNVHNHHPKLNSVLKLCFIYVIVLGAYLLIRKIIIGITIHNEPTSQFHIFENTFTGLIIFLKLFIVPFPLKFHRPYTLSDISMFQFIALWLLLILWCIYVFIKAKQNEWRPLFALFWLYALFPAAIAYAETQIIAERYFYVLTLAPIMMGAFFAQAFLKRTASNKSHVKQTLNLGFLCVFTFNIYFTRCYAQMWENEDTLFGHSAQNPPASYELIYDLAHNYMERNDTENAMKYFKLSAKLNPNYGRAYNNVGVLYLRQNKFKEALPMFELASKIYPDEARYPYNMALAYEQLGKVDLAIQSVKEALKRNPNYPNAQDLLAKLLKTKK